MIGEKLSEVARAETCICSSPFSMIPVVWKGNDMVSFVPMDPKKSVKKQVNRWSSPAQTRRRRPRHRHLRHGPSRYTAQVRFEPHPHPFLLDHKPFRADRLGR